MITVITGVPGTGKSALIVSMLLQIAKTGRKIYVDNIPELAIDHEPAGDILKWPDWAEEGALIVIDECQRHFRPRHSSAAVPRHVAELETHRHRGLDFWLITQRPALIESNIRGLCGRHIAIRNTFFGRYTYEWPEMGDVESETSRAIAAKARYKLPRHVFSLYKSASVHTKTSAKMPTPAKIALGCLAFSIIGGTYFYQQYAARFSHDKNAVTAQLGNGVVPSVAVVPAAQPAGSGTGVLGESVQDYLPAIPNQPETAPLYRAVRQVVAMPWPSACVASETRCLCYTSQGTRLGNIDQDACLKIVTNGPQFNPYRAVTGEREAQPTHPVSAVVASASAPSPPLFTFQ